MSENKSFNNDSPSLGGTAASSLVASLHQLANAAATSESNDGAEAHGDTADNQDDDEVDDDDDEEEEPLLKYQRLGNSVVELVKSDMVACLVTHERFLALGTHWGRVIIVDFNGNQIRRFTHHTATVNDVCIDSSGEWIASCSDDGRVVICSVFGDETHEYNYGRPILSVQLDPHYAKKTQRPFWCGGRAGQLIKNEKGFFRAKDEVMHSGEGAIYTIRWHDTLIAWANDVGVKVYDTQAKQRISYIDRPENSPRADLYPCHLYWSDERTLLIGWADTIKRCVVRERDMGTTLQTTVPPRYLQIQNVLQTDFWVCGLAPFGDNLVALAYVDADDEETPDAAAASDLAAAAIAAPNSLRPELRVISWDDKELSHDALTLHDFEKYRAADYALFTLQGASAQDALFYVVSPRDIVWACPCDLDDHVSFLMESGKYEEALLVATEADAQLRTHTLEEIGCKYIEHLLDVGEVEAAAVLCPKILRQNAKLWEDWVLRFAKINQLWAISPHIPVGNPTLSDFVYEMVLNHFLSTDQKRFLETIRQWPSELYSVPSIITAVKQRLKTESNETLMDALALLYTYDEQYDKTLHIYLRLRRGNVFSLIKEHNLFDAVRDKARLLLEFDEQRAVELLAENTERIPIADVVEQLKEVPRLQHVYLHALFRRDVLLAADYHELQVELYAKYDYPFLLPFLRQSNSYRLEKAYKVCVRENLYPEQVFILGRMGNSKQALSLIMEKLGDVKQAIDFVQTQHDDDLWEDLIDYSMRNPKFIAGLLEHIGAHVDPIKLIRRIPTGMEIDGLRDRLVKIISDFNLQCQLREGCNKVLKADCVHLFTRLYNGHTNGLPVDPDNATSSRCATCQASVFATDDDSGIVVFWCTHVYHVRCLSTAHGGQAAATDRLQRQQQQQQQQQEQLLLAQRGGGGGGGGGVDLSASNFDASLDAQALVCVICQSLKQAKRKTRRF